jgi:hypothetical protein
MSIKHTPQICQPEKAQAERLAQLENWILATRRRAAHEHLDEREWQKVDRMRDKLGLLRRESIAVAEVRA